MDIYSREEKYFNVRDMFFLFGSLLLFVLSMKIHA